jgi:hypothetical protein
MTQDQWIADRHAALIREGIEGIAEYEHLFPHLAPGLRAYLESRQETGGFLRSVLENDLAQAVNRIDRTQSIEILRALVHLVWNYFPAASHGSAENVQKWLGER